VRCINADGVMMGVVATKDALKMAMDQGLDLVEISPNAAPPVCRIMDFGKFLYEEQRKKKEARKHQHGQVVKEMKFHANVAEHDYQTKINHVKEFLEKGYKVKLSLTFRGRENVHREFGFEVVNRVLKDTEGLCAIDMAPRMMGRSIISMITGKGKS
jgi:translation initiation factor IF-3